MAALDIFTRCIFIPGIFLFILTFIPEAVQDVKEWRKLFIQDECKVKRSKKKAVQVHTAATVYSNSYFQIPKNSDKIILSHE